MLRVGFKERLVYHTASISHPEEVLKNGIWQPFMELDPRFWVYYQGNLTPLDQLLLEHNPAPIFRGEEMLEGSRCMKFELQIEPQYQDVSWFDVEHGYMARQRNLYGHTATGQSFLAYQIKVPKIAESNGIWFPTLVEVTANLLAPATMKSDRIRTENGLRFMPPIVKRVVISDFNAGESYQLPPDAFNLNWPIGTEVTDQFHNKVYHVRAVNDDERGQQTPQTPNTAKEQQPKVPANAGSKATTRP